MASNYTTNFGLCQWEAADQVQRTEFNVDNATVETALDALNFAVDKCGNCKILYGNYVGNNKIGSANCTSLTFSYLPLLVLIFDIGFGGYMFLPYGSKTAFMKYFEDTGMQSTYVAWSGNTVFWWGNDTLSQANDAARNYFYIALVAADT